MIFLIVLIFVNEELYEQCSIDLYGILLNFHIAMANIPCTFCETALEGKSTKLWLKGPGGLVSMEPSIACDS